MTKYIEIRKIDMSEIRGLCIKKNWFTRGNNEEYAELLNYAHCDNITTEELTAMAQLIWDHSKLDQDMPFTEIMYQLAKICYTYFDEI